MTLVHLGIILGVIGAVLQAANYAFTKDVQEKYSLKGLRLLVAVHAFMGILMFFPFIWCRHYQYLGAETLLRIFVVIIPYLAGQYFCNLAIALSDSSIVSPLLTLKIPILAGMTFFFMGQHFGTHQFLAIGVIMAMGCLLSMLSGRLRAGPLVCVIVCCILYGTSDMGTAAFMRYLEDSCGVSSRAEQIFLLNTYEFLFCFLPALPLFALKRLKLHPRQIWQARWMGGAWIISSFGIVACFNLAGLVEGNIIQSLRSILGIFVAYLFYRRYIQDPGTFRRKLAIAAGMFAAVVLYYV